MKASRKPSEAFLNSQKNTSLYTNILQAITANTWPDPEYGGKVYGLIHLLQNSVNIPPAYLMSHKQLERFLDGQPNKALQLAWEYDLSKLFAQHPIWIFRSSASCEDGNVTAMAGQFHSQTAFDVPTALQALRACWNSHKTEDICAYLQCHGQSTFLRMTIIAQQWVEGKVSGVTFAQDNGVLSEAIWGQGRLLVGGFVTPQQYFNGIQRIPKQQYVAVTANRDDLYPGDPLDVQISESINFNSNIEVFQCDERVAYLPLPAPLQQLPCLTPTQQSHIEAESRRLQQSLGHDIDTEWVIDTNNTLWWVQIRPATRQLLMDSLANSLSEEGTPISAGLVHAHAWVAMNPQEAEGAPQPHILVAPYTTPEWTQALMRCAGVITAEGGILSHTAIVARELGIPAMAGFDIQTLQTGMPLTLDTDTGTVTIHEHLTAVLGPPAEPTNRPVLIFDAALQPLSPDQPYLHMTTSGKST